MSDNAFGAWRDRLRPISEADLARVLEWRNSPEVRVVMYTSREISMTEHKAWFERMAHDNSRRTWIFEADGEPMGVVNLTHIDMTTGEAHWGFYVRPGAPKGSGFRLGRLALAEVFGQLALNRLSGEVLASNEASLRFHRKLGFEHVRVLKEHHRDESGAHDVHVFGLTRAAWERSRAADLAQDAVLAHAKQLYGAGRLREAADALREVVATRPNDAEAHKLLGNGLMQLKRYDDAEQAYKQALTLTPQDADVLANLGRVLYAQQRLPEAALASHLAVTVRPDFVEAQIDVACVLRDLGRLPESEATLRTAIEKRPDYADAHFNLGIVLEKTARFAEAEAAYREALRLRPDAAAGYNNLGNVLHQTGRPQEAADVYRQALALNPNGAPSHYNLATALRALELPDEAEPHYRRALELKPDYFDAQFGLGTLLLSLGRFEEGWRLFESRYALPRFLHYKTKATLPLPQWQGESLEGRSLLVWQEDGLGDVIQFGRYLPLLKAAGAARIDMVCAPSLHRLFADIEGVDGLLTHDAAAGTYGDYDCWTSLLSVPMHLRTTLETIPPAHYLQVDQSRAAHWHDRLKAALPRGPRIGLVWKGNPHHHNDAHRSLNSVAQLLPLWSIPGVSFVSLQKGRDEDEAQTPQPFQPMLALGHELTDFADTAALIAQLDLVVCVDTSTAHLAASLGKPCFVLLPYHDPDWRWLYGRTDSPWYPGTMRVFRQPRAGNWSAPVEAALQACLARFQGESTTGV
ncbi:UDP-4-amino-4,6-dideoxy-N-acetyl-beta-L-altrosamine N-acetyltransferase [Trinickia sp.]|uniref:UDP-4-amino-4, 6-dideoxy-N-acetyl-beta-L-altrosamine N-acetyltransferase n=1 Tax=Trinickia sp. TaxID=2571163 RepID=UPI003F7E4F96